MLSNIFNRTPPLEYGRPPVITGTRTMQTTGFHWYEKLIDYQEVGKLIDGFVGKVAVIDDTANVTNGYLAGNVDTVYDFTGEGGISGFHGHHVSGIIASKKHGLFKNLRLGLFKALSAHSGKGTPVWIKSAIEAAQIEGYEVINASIGAPFLDKGVEAAIKLFCATPTRFFIAASGNSNEYSDAPARLAEKVEGVISVGALEYSDDEYRIAVFSSWGVVTVVAPGVDILSTFPDNKEEYLSGTSMATPFVAALIASAKAIKPNLTHTDFIKILATTTERLDTVSEHKQGRGILKVVDFLKEVHRLKDVPSSQAEVQAPTEKPNIFCRFLHLLK